MKNTFTLSLDKIQETSQEISNRDIIQKEIAQKIIDANYFGIMFVAPRVGKTRITLKYLIKPTDKVLVVYPEKNIKQSWINEIEELKYDNYDIHFSTNKSICKLKIKYDLIVIDECHSLSPQQIIDLKKLINFWEVKKVIGLSGSISEKTALELKEGLDLEIKSVYSIDDAIKDQIVKDYQINIIEVPLNTKKILEVKTKTGKFYTSEKEMYNWYSREIENMTYGFPINYTKLKIFRLLRMNLIKNSQAKIDLVKSLLWKWKNERVLVFTGLTKVADNLGCPSYHSNSKTDKNKNDFLESKINHLSVVNKLSVGITFRNLSKTIVGFFDSNEENLFQKISRSLVFEYTSNKAEVYIICSNEEAERKWLNSALKFFDNSKIKYITLEEI